MVLRCFFRTVYREIRFTEELGTTLIEMVVTVAVATIVAGMAVSNIRAMERPLQSASHQLAGVFKQARAKAIGTTNAYTLQPLNTSKIIAKFGTSCTAATQTTDSRFSLTLPANIRLNDTTWKVCYSPRGIADSSPTITLTGPDYSSQDVEVYIGGAVRVVGNH